MQMYAAQESNKVVASIEGTFGVEKVSIIYCPDCLTLISTEILEC